MEAKRSSKIHCRNMQKTLLEPNGNEGRNSGHKRVVSNHTGRSPYVSIEQTPKSVERYSEVNPHWFQCGSGSGSMGPTQFGSMRIPILVKLISHQRLNFYKANMLKAF
jgi:hypothetical protein